MQGRLSEYLENSLFRDFRSREFRGRFEISGYPETEAPAWALIGSWHGGEYWGTIGYGDPVIIPAWVDASVELWQWPFWIIGIDTTFLFHQAVISVPDESWRYWHYIVLNAATREEALETLHTRLGWRLAYRYGHIR